MKPYIICHMISSVDGKIQVERWLPPSGVADNQAVSQLYEQTAGTFSADAWLVGRRTMASFAGLEQTRGNITTDAHQHQLPREPCNANHHNRSLVVVLDTKGKLVFNSPLLGDEHIVAILAENISDNHLSDLKNAGISWIFAGNNGDDMAKALHQLNRVFGINTLLLEGGGIINATFLHAGFIDELSLIIYPTVDGSAGISSLFDLNNTTTPAMRPQLKLMQMQPLSDGAVWLQYRVHAQPV